MTAESDKNIYERVNCIFGEILGCHLENGTMKECNQQGELSPKKRTSFEYSTVHSRENESGPILLLSTFHW